MGCWNETNMLTGVPIPAGERCLAVILLQNHGRNGGCYPCHAYLPIMAIEGDYNEYGTLENTDPGWDKMIKAAFPDLARDAAPEGITTRFIQDANGGGLSVTEPGKDSTATSVRVAFLTSRTVDLAVKYYRDTYPKEAGELEKILGSAAGFTRSGDGTKDYFAWRNIMRDIRPAVTGQYTSLLANLIIQDCFQIDPDLYAESVHMTAMLNEFLDDVREAWHIPSGSGSQRGATPAMALLNEFTAGCIQEEMEYQRQLEEDDFEDEDD